MFQGYSIPLDLSLIPENIKNHLNIHPVKWIDQVLEYALEKMPKPLSEHETEVPTAVAEAEKDPKAAITH
mgnify:CR=1 FL=1